MYVHLHRSLAVYRIRSRAEAKVFIGSGWLVWDIRVSGEADIRYATRQSGGLPRRWSPSLPTTARASSSNFPG